MHIKYRCTIGTQSICPMELLAAVAAPQLAANIAKNEIVTDALGWCQIAKKKAKRPQLNNIQTTLMNLPQHYPQEIRWHPQMDACQSSKKEYNASERVKI